jgi:hypothetical protein
MFKVGEHYISLIDNITYLILSSNNVRTAFFVCGKSIYQKYSLVQSCDNTQIALKINKKRYMKI